MVDEKNDPNQDTEDNAGFDEQAQAEMARMLTSVKDMAIYNLSVLSSQAWHHLGLAPIPGVSDPEEDLEQAKLAIDLFDANLQVLKPHMEKDHAKSFDQVLMDLQLNYVNKSKKE